VPDSHHYDIVAKRSLSNPPGGAYMHAYHGAITIFMLVKYGGSVAGVCAGIGWIIGGVFIRDSGMEKALAGALIGALVGIKRFVE
jgi:hypothetical protein